MRHVERDPARVVAFSDAVVAIAVTLLLPEIPPHDTGHPLHGLATLWQSYLAYGVTFMSIGQIWANHHVMFDHIRGTDRAVLFLNTVLLMDNAFLSFASSALAQAFRDGQRAARSTSSGGTPAMIAGCSPPSIRSARRGAPAREGRPTVRERVRAGQQVGNVPAQGWVGEVGEQLRRKPGCIRGRMG